MTAATNAQHGAVARVLAVARNAGVPVVFVDPRRKPWSHFEGPFGVTSVRRGRGGRPAVYVALLRDYLDGFPKIAALLAHEVAHAVAWAMSGVEPLAQDEAAGFEPVERAIRKAARLGSYHVFAWNRDVQVPWTDIYPRGKSGLEIQADLRPAEKARLRRLGDKCLREGAWTTRQKEEVRRG